MAAPNLLWASAAPFPIMVKEFNFSFPDIFKGSMCFNLSNLEQVPYIFNRVPESTPQVSVVATPTRAPLATTGNAIHDVLTIRTESRTRLGVS